MDSNSIISNTLVCSCSVYGYGCCVYVQFYQPQCVTSHIIRNSIRRKNLKRFIQLSQIIFYLFYCCGLLQFSFFFFLLEHICKSCTIVHTYVYMAGRSMIFRAIYSQPMSQHHNRETEIIQSYRKRTSIRSFMKFLFLKYNKIV